MWASTYSKPYSADKPSPCPISSLLNSNPSPMLLLRSSLDSSPSRDSSAIQHCKTANLSTIVHRSLLFSAFKSASKQAKNGYDPQMC